MEIEQKNPYEQKKGRMIISCSISPEFWKLAKNNHIGWSEALRAGIAILLAERGHSEYDNRLNIYRKMRFFQSQAEEALQEAEDLKARLSKFGDNKLTEEADEILEEKPLGDTTVRK